MDKSGQVKKRRVFYIPGFDPFPPRRYRELYRTESQKQALISGYEIAQTPLQQKPFGWRVTAQVERQETVSDITVLEWADIVQDGMSKGILATYLNMLRTAWIYIGSGALFRLMRLRKGPVIAALYPVGFLIGQLLIALLIAYFTARVIGLFAPSLAVIACVLIWPILNFFRKIDGKIFAYYLMQDYAHSAQHRGAYPEDLKVRLREFETLISEALKQDFDEVLLVGHSSGAHLGVSVLAALARRGDLAQAKMPVGFLTLGQVVPMVSFLPNAGELRRDLNALSEEGKVFWLDVTAPGDGCAFALCDPMAVTGVAPTAKKWPIVISAAFTQTLAPETWKALRWRFFRLHFQYLCAFERPHDYDYFMITAGPVLLQERFDGRVPSKSRIETPVNRYRTMAP